MSRNQREIRENVIDMMSELVYIHKHMPSSKMKRELNDIINMLNVGVDFSKIIKRIELNINKGKEASVKGNRNTSLTSDNIFAFWGRIKDIIMNTYKRNKEL